MKESTMPYHTIPLELIFAGSIWLTAIFIFVVMLIAALASLRSTEKTEVKTKPVTERTSNSVAARVDSKRKIKAQREQ
jgi:hypothetical protein